MQKVSILVLVDGVSYQAIRELFNLKKVSGSINPCFSGWGFLSDEDDEDDGNDEYYVSILVLVDGVSYHIARILRDKKQRSCINPCFSGWGFLSIMTMLKLQTNGRLYQSLF